jgi:hypothetical protein
VPPKTPSEQKKGSAEEKNSLLLLCFGARAPKKMAPSVKLLVREQKFFVRLDKL